MEGSSPVSSPLYPHLLAAASSSPVLASILTPVVAGLLAAVSSSSVLLTPVLTGILTGLAAVIRPRFYSHRYAPTPRRAVVAVVTVSSSSRRRRIVACSPRCPACSACSPLALPGIVAATHAVNVKVLAGCLGSRPVRPPQLQLYAPNQVIFFRTSSAGQANMIVESNTAGPTTARSL